MKRKGNVKCWSSLISHYMFILKMCYLNFHPLHVMTTKTTMTRICFMTMTMTHQQPWWHIVFHHILYKHMYYFITSMMFNNDHNDCKNSHHIQWFSISFYDNHDNNGHTYNFSSCSTMFYDDHDMTL